MSVLSVTSLFSGAGMQERGLENAGKEIGFDIKVVQTCEMDIYAIQTYAAIHNGLTKEMVENYDSYPSREEMAEELKAKRIGYDFVKDKEYDWDKKAKSKSKDLETTWLACKLNHNVGDIMKVKELEYCDMLTWSFPCITEDSLILTKDGYKEMKDVKVGDIVLTKSGEWHPVAKKFDNGIHETCYIDAMGFENIHCTLNHKFYVREMYRTWPYLSNGKRANVRKFKEPEWKEAKDLTRKDYFGVPVIQEETPFYTDDLDFWYMAGFYVGDGYLSVDGYDVRLCCSDSKLAKLEKHINKDKYNYTVNDMNLSCHKLRFADKEVYEFLKQNFGTGCETKHIPSEVLLMPKAQLEAFLNGYIDSDGNTNHYGKNPYIRIDSVNRNLIYSIGIIIEKLYHRPVSIYKANKRNKDHYIDGRKIDYTNGIYEIKFKHETSKQDQAFYEDGYIWYPFRSLIKDTEQHVYNMEIEEDHSYIIQGCISKNCTDLSVAGKQAGLVKSEDGENGTRSGLVYEVIRLLNVAKENGTLPKFMIMENVDALVNKKNKPAYELINEELSEIGYNCYYEIMNTKYTGIPQNRARCYAMYVRKDIDQGGFTFPLKFDNGIRLKDILEENVDEKYFIKNEKAQELIDKLIESGKVSA